MSEAQESFIESKLGHVIELARSGYGVGVKPDGTIVAERADHLSKVMYDPDPALSEEQRLLIREGVVEGARVRQIWRRTAISPSRRRTAGPM